VQGVRLRARACVCVMRTWRCARVCVCVCCCQGAAGAGRRCTASRALSHVTHMSHTCHTHVTHTSHTHRITHTRHVAHAAQLIDYQRLPGNSRSLFNTAAEPGGKTELVELRVFVRKGGRLKYELDGLRWKSSICDDGSGEGPPTGASLRGGGGGGGACMCVCVGWGGGRACACVRACACACVCVGGGAGWGALGSARAAVWGVGRDACSAKHTCLPGLTSHTVAAVRCCCRLCAQVCSPSDSRVAVMWLAQACTCTASARCSSTACAEHVGSFRGRLGAALAWRGES
jgi:hypothetical protein